MMNRQTVSRFSFGAALLLAAAVGGPLAQQYLLPARAQVSAGSTWVNAGNVGGTASAVVLSGVPANSMADMLGVTVRFLPTGTNAAGGTTIQINSIDGGHAVKRISGGSLVAIAGGDFTTSVPVEAMWDGTEFVQKNPATGNSSVGTEASFTNTVPAGWLVEDGSCYSRTTYSALFAYYGSTDLWATQAGSSCSGSQFTVPKANGRLAVAVQNQGTGTGPLTSCTAGIANNCGAQAIAQAMLPSVNFNFNLTATATLNLGACNPGAGSCSNGGQNFVLSGTNNDTFNTANNITFDSSPAQGSAASGGSGTAFVPSNYQVFKAVKY